MGRTLTIEELADETGADTDLLRRLTDIGVLGPGADQRYSSGDIIRVEAMRAFLDAGVSIEKIAAALEQGLFTFEYLDRFHPEPAPRSAQSYGQFSRSLGETGELLPAIYLAMGFPEPSPDHILRKDEEEILRELVATWGNADGDAVVRAARLIGEPARLVSEGWTRLYVEKISDPLTARNVPMEERIETIVATTERAARLAPQMLQWLLQRHMRHAIDRANIEGLEEVMAQHGLSIPAPPRLPAIAFVDVSGYTSMTERHGDELAVRTSDVLREAAQRSARAHDGSVVKILGDGAMLHFDEVDRAVEAVVELVRQLEREGLPSHAGIHAGALIEHDGDYFGRTVNLASRVANVAGPGQVVVTRQVVESVHEGRLAFGALDAVSLKGVSEPVPLYLVTPD